MTIGIGFRCDDGVVLCADTQITYPDMKDYESKVSAAVNRGVVAWCYSGYPNVARLMDKGIRAAITKERVKNADSMGPIIEREMKELNEKHRKDMKTQEFLFAMSFPQEKAVLMYAFDGQVEERDWGAIGSGFSPLVMYLVNSLKGVGASRTADYALNLAIYITMQEKQFGGGVGGNTHALVVRPNGGLTDYSYGNCIADRESTLKVFHEEMCRLFGLAAGREMSDTELDMLIGGMCQKLKKERATD
jgi:20S proteasome alpha/beta subunit